MLHAFPIPFCCRIWTPAVVAGRPPPGRTVICRGFLPRLYSPSFELNDPCPTGAVPAERAWKAAPAGAETSSPRSQPVPRPGARWARDTASS